MTWQIKTPILGATPITTRDAAENPANPVGTIVQAHDATYKSGEFIYLKGINSTIVGSVVTYHLSTFTTALATSVVGVSNPVAIAMSACVTGEFGWYQISGLALAGKANTLSLAVTLPLAAASGLMIAAATTNRLSGCVTAAVASASTLVITVPVMLSRPTTGGGEV
jgi:hypothetical protein